MKPQLIFLVLILMIIPAFSKAQLKVPVKKKVEKKTEKEANEAVDDAIDNTFDKLFGKKKKKATETETEPQNQESEVSEESTVPDKDAGEPLRSWTKFDFVPGEVVIFEDNLENEVNGEFPSKWALDHGNVEIAKDGEDYVINFPATGNATIVPLMNNKEDYLPEKFTLEFDAYFSEFCTTYKIEIFDRVNQKVSPTPPFVGVRATDVYVEGYGGTNVEEPNQTYPFWKHISISFNIRAFKVYYGEKRTANIPNLKFDPTGISISSSQCHAGNQAMIKNIRIAEGSMDLYERFITDGKIVTNGIKFDVNKSTLRPESMGVINEVFKLMEEHPEISFSVEGHTDSDGEEDFNQTLSEQRANTVVDKLVEMGIDPDRLVFFQHRDQFIGYALGHHGRGGRPNANHFHMRDGMQFGNDVFQPFR